MNNTDTENFLARFEKIPLYELLLSTEMKDLNWSPNEIRFMYPKTGESFSYNRINQTIEHKYSDVLGPIRSNLEYVQKMLGMDIPEFFSALRAGGSALPNASIPEPSTEGSVRDFPQFKILHDRHIHRVAEGDLKHIPLPILKGLVTPMSCELWYGKHEGYMFKNDSGSKVLNFSDNRSLTEGNHDVYTMDKNKKTLNVYECMGDYLAHRVLSKNAHTNASALILTDVVLFEKSRPFMEQHKTVNLYFPNQERFDKYQGYAKWLDPDKYQDKSNTYRNSVSLFQELNSEMEKQNIKKNKGMKL